MIILENINLRINNKMLIEDGKMTLKEGNVYVVLGESGSGKTTLLHEISLLSKVSQSSYFWDGKHIDSLSQEEKADIRRLDIGYVMQDLELISDKLTLKDNIQCMCSLTDKKYDEKLVLKYMHELNLYMTLDETVEKMSRGERQRFALVLALIKDAKLFICDEPTSALDEENAKEFMVKLKYIAHVYNKIVMIATHDQLVRDYADCIYLIHDKSLLIEMKHNVSKVNLDKRNNFGRVQHSLYSVYKKGYHTLQKRIMNIIYILLICLLCLAPIVLNKLLEKNKTIYDLIASHEIVMQQEYGDAFDDLDINLLKEIQHVQDIYAYYELDGYIDDKGEVKSVRLVPKTDIDQYTISSSLIKNTENRLMLTIEYNYQEYEINIDSYIVKDYVKNKNSDIEIVYVPITLWNNLIQQIGLVQSYMLLVYCDEIDNVSNMINEIQKWMPAVRIQSDTIEYMDHIEILENIKDYIVFLQIAVTGVTCAIAYLAIYLENKSRIKEITNLRINGFNQKHFYTLYMYENMMVVFIVFSMVMIIFLLINSSYNSSFMFMDMLHLIVKTFGYLVITKVIPVFIVVRKIFEKDVSVYLRGRF